MTNVELKERPAGETAESVQITDLTVIRAALADPEFPLLVSFPRTGSHWLRMLMELYFERPSLVRVFYYADRTDWLTLHTHAQPGDLMDRLGETCERRDVIYLYRDPVHTVYSQLRFYDEPVDDEGRIRHWADAYGRHVERWLGAECVAKRKAVVTYEGMRRDLPREFAKVAAFFGGVLEAAKLEAAAARVTKDALQKKVGDAQPNVVDTSETYNEQRETFEGRHASLIWDTVLAQRADLERHFAYLGKETP
jgi:hypothetical protein